MSSNTIDTKTNRDKLEVVLNNMRESCTLYFEHIKIPYKLEYSPTEGTKIKYVPPEKDLKNSDKDQEPKDMDISEFLTKINDGIYEEYSIFFSLKSIEQNLTKDESRFRYMATYIPELSAIVILSKYRGYCDKNGIELKALDLEIYLALVLDYNTILHTKQAYSINELKALCSNYSSIVALPNKIGDFYLNARHNILFDNLSEIREYCWTVNEENILPVYACTNFIKSRGYVLSESDFSFLFTVRPVIEKVMSSSELFRELKKLPKIDNSGAKKIIRESVIKFLVYSFNLDLISGDGSKQELYHSIKFDETNKIVSIGLGSVEIPDNTEKELIRFGKVLGNAGSFNPSVSSYNISTKSIMDIIMSFKVSYELIDVEKLSETMEEVYGCHKS